jgi:hypothetical protein
MEQYAFTKSLIAWSAAMTVHAGAIHNSRDGTLHVVSHLLFAINHT